jgi:hypothetical protein
MKYESYCEEHDLKLVSGCCPKCRDAEGRMFPLDMQSIYLKKTKETSTFDHQSDSQILFDATHNTSFGMK